MSDDKSISLINLGELSKPADTLIKKVSAAVGGVFEPWQIKRVAKAEAESSLIKATSEIEITDLHRRAMSRFVEEEATRQENMEDITKKSIPYLDEESDPSKMDNDWVTNFFDKSRIVSDDEMQNLWAQVLAGEANSPGTYSKRTVNFLSSLDKKDAELFQSLCRYCWHIGEFIPLVFDAQNSIYNKNGINFDTLSHLDSIGLISFGGITGYNKQGLPKTFAVLYCGKPLVLTMQSEKDNTLSIGNALFTKMGHELLKISQSPSVDGFEDYVKEQWKAHMKNDEPA